MKIDPPVAPTGQRIAGTLHKRGYERPAPASDESRPSDKAEESEAASRRKNSGQTHHKEAH